MSGEETGAGLGTVVRALPWKSLLLVVVLAVAAIAFLRLDLGRVAAAIGGLNLQWGMLGLMAYIAAQLCFATRWWTLIESSRRPPWITVLRYSLIGAMLNAILPLRGGDVARAFIVSRGNGIPLGDAGGVVAAERVGDALTVVILGAWLATHLVLPPGTVQTLIALPLLIVVAVVGLFLGFRLGLIARLISLLPMRFSRRLASGVAGLKAAVQRLADLRILILATLAHAAGWAAVLGALMAFLAGLSIAVPAMDAALGILVMTSLGGMFIQVPAGLGTWHMLAAAALTLWGVPAETGVAYAIVAHAAGIAVPIAGGLLATLGSTVAADALRTLRRT